jgi:hypothetical protein
MRLEPQRSRLAGSAEGSAQGLDQPVVAFEGGAVGRTHQVIVQRAALRATAISTTRTEPPGAATAPPGSPLPTPAR